ncbi:hypothetical protein GBAR_LOCUS2278, partial [Geodia barretti]
MKLLISVIVWGPLSQPLHVLVETTDNGAAVANFDYHPLQQTVTFEPTESLRSQQCLKIELIDDSLAEFWEIASCSFFWEIASCSFLSDNHIGSCGSFPRSRSGFPLGVHEEKEERRAASAQVSGSTNQNKGESVVERGGGGGQKHLGNPIYDA